MISSTVQQWQSIVDYELTALEILDGSVAPLYKALGLTRDLFIQTVLGIIAKESSGNQFASGDAGRSFGLMQLNWAARDEYSIYNTTGFSYPVEQQDGSVTLEAVASSSELYEPEKNIGVGIRYLLHQMDELRNMDAAILAYNGPRSARAWLSGQVQQASNVSYLDDVLALLDVPLSFFSDLAKKKTVRILLLLLGGGILAAVVWRLVVQTSAR